MNPTNSTSSVLVLPNINCASHYQHTLRRRFHWLGLPPARLPALLCPLQVYLELGPAHSWAAVKSAMRAVELRGDWGEAHVSLARAQAGYGEPELALESLQRAVAAGPAAAAGLAEEAAALGRLVAARHQGGGGTVAARLPVRDK